MKDFPHLVFAKPFSLTCWMGLSWKEASEPMMKSCATTQHWGGTHVVQQITISISKTEKQGPNAAHFRVGRCLL